MTPAITIRKLLLAGMLGSAMLLNTACTGSEENERPEDSEPTMARPDTMNKEDRLKARMKIEESRPVQQSPVKEWPSEPAVDGVTGEVPGDLLDKIFADLERRTGAQRSAFSLLQAEARQWNDGALGCAEPGQVYTQAIVDGYQVIVEYRGERFDYHASGTGFFKLCSRFLPNR